MEVASWIALVPDSRFNAATEVGGAALRDDIARTAFTLATLGGHAKFELTSSKVMPART